MSLAHEPVFVWMSQFAFQPNLVYGAIVAMMFLSAVGLPVPEEVTLLSVGLLAFMGANPHLFPPPFEGAPVINPTEAAIVATFAVFSADFFIYWVGRIWGRKLLNHPRMMKIVSPALLQKAEDFTRKYGALATGMFRFTPGIRFPGHLLCGTLRFSAWKFATIDGIAVAISVPTQILLLAHYGEPILVTLKKFKLVVLALLGLAIVAWIAVKLRDRYRARIVER